MCVKTINRTVSSKGIDWKGYCVSPLLSSLSSAYVYTCLRLTSPTTLRPSHRQNWVNHLPMIPFRQLLLSYTDNRYNVIFLLLQNTPIIMYVFGECDLTKQVFRVEISKLIFFVFFFCFRSVYLGLDEETYASIKDSVKELWNLIG